MSSMPGQDDDEGRLESARPAPLTLVGGENEEEASMANDAPATAPIGVQPIRKIPQQIERLLAMDGVLGQVNKVLPPFPTQPLPNGSRQCKKSKIIFEPFPVLVADIMWLLLFLHL